MTIGSPSGSGATQNEIANGVDESDARFQIYAETSLANAQPSQISTEGSGALPSFDENGAVMSSGTTDDDGLISPYGVSFGKPDLSGVGALLFKVQYASSVSITSLSDDHAIGVVRGGSPVEDKDDIAIFYPTAGDSTPGNIRVDSGGTDNDGSISYPTLTELHSYTLLIDLSGVYLSQNETGFYVDGDPRKGDSADAVISATPQFDSASFPQFSIQYESNGNSQELITPYIELRVRQ